jgi:hypothetical protein
VHNAQAEQVADSLHQLQPAESHLATILGLLLQQAMQAEDGQPQPLKNHRSKSLKINQSVHPFLVNS